MTSIFICPQCGTETVMGRQGLPDRRSSWTQKARVGGQAVHLNMGEYPDGTLGEIFIDMHKTGSGVRGFTSAFARLFSVALQHGVPLAVLVKTLEDIDFPPQGPVEGQGVAVPSAKSILDWVVRELAAAYLAKKEPIILPPDSRMEEALDKIVDVITGEEDEPDGPGTESEPEPVQRSTTNKPEGNEGRAEGPLP